MIRVIIQPKYTNCAVFLVLAVLTSFDIKTVATGSTHKKPFLHDSVRKHLYFSRSGNHKTGFQYQSALNNAIDLPVIHGLDSMDTTVLSNLESDTHLSSRNPKKNTNTKPFFGELVNRRVVTRAGQTASLTCTVHNIGNRQVSWIRGRDLHVLSSGLVVFATDSRVRVTASGSSWTLTISYSQPQDGGSYACQINTQQPIATWLNLIVIEARANIEGPSTIYVQAGSNISITCFIKEELIIPGLVLWYHGDALVPRDSRRIQVGTEVTNVTTSQLNISGAMASDSGNYSCWPSSGKQDTVLVHVIQGESPAAIQHGNSSPSPSLHLRAFLTLFSLLSPVLMLPGWIT